MVFSYPDIDRSVERRGRDVWFRAIRSRGAFDAAGGLSRLRVQEHDEQSDGAFIIYSIPADVTYPGGEVGHGDEFLTQPCEIGNGTPVHKTRRTFIAWDGSAFGL